MDPQIKQRRTLDAIKQILLRESLNQPLAIIFEDLHWIDDHTHALLDLLADSIANARVLLLVNYRPEYRHSWGNKSYYSQLQLASLDQDGAAAMLTALLGDAAKLNPLKRIIVERTEGNPFFIEEIVQVLFEDGALARNGTVAVTRSLSQLRLPPTVQGILAARIDRLAVEQKELLQILAVAGRGSPLALIRRVAEHSAARLDTILAELQNGEFIYERPGSGDTEYVFKHALTQEVAYNSLLIERRKILHEHVGRALEAAFRGQLDDRVNDLAYHYGRTDNHGKAVEYLYLAGKQASSRAAHPEAISHFREALERLKHIPAPTDDEQHCTILLALADEQERAGEILEAQQRRLSVIDLARTASSQESLVTAALGLVRLTIKFGISAEGVPTLLEDSLHKVGSEDSPIRAKILCGLAALLGSLGERERAADLGEEGLAISRRLGDQELLCRYLGRVSYGLQLPWSTARLHAYATEMVDISKALNDRNFEAEAREWKVYALFSIGEISAADRESEFVARLSEGLNEPFNQGLALQYRAARALMRGQFDESEQLARQDFAIGQRLQTGAAAGLFGLQMFGLARERGQLRELEPVLRLFMKERGAAGAWRTGLALIYAELGRIEEARIEFHSLARLNFDDLRQDAMWMGSIAYLADICVYLRDRVRAQHLYRILLPFDGLNTVVGYSAACYGASSRYLGMLAALLENWNDAARHFEDALAMNARIDAPVWVAHTQYQYAMMLLARGLLSDRERAFEMLGSATATARALGMRSLEERARAAFDS
jgi:tetratricopeptide (TPR) repeat protein